MSGIEATGLVLAVFPLLLSALENYRESAEVLGDWWKFKRKYTKCKRDIEFHQITFTANLEELLLPLIVEDDELDGLLSEPGGPRWADNVLESRLRERLPNSYDSYLNSIAEINGVMEELKKELGLDNLSLQARVAGAGETAQPNKSRMSKENLGYQAQRIKFALGQSTREKHFEEFAKYNGRLSDLLRTGDRIAAIKRNDGPKLHSMVSNFWKHAKTFYGLLSTSWCCECCNSHHANLLLQHRTGPEIDFNVLLLFARELIKSSGSSCWTSHQLQFKPVEEKPVRRISSAASILSTPPRPAMLKQKSSSFARPSILARSKLGMVQSKSSLELSSPRRSSTKKSMGITWTDSHCTLVETQPPSPEEPEPNPTIPIKDLCHSLANGIPPDGILESKDDPQSTAYTIQLLPKDDSYTSTTLTLEDLLSLHSKHAFPRRKRYLVALILASSQIQLQSSQWLGSFSKSDIIFSIDPSTNTPAFHKPHISRDLSPSAFQKPLPNPASGSDQPVTVLGILLLELCFGVALVNHPIRQRYPVMDGPQNFYLDLAAALEWSALVNDEAGAGYAGAVGWCLGRNMVGMEGEGWRAELHKNVVRPLGECCEHLG